MQQKQNITENSSSFFELNELLTFDVIVVGAGMIGAAMALGLCQLGMKVALIEKNKLSEDQFVLDEEPDIRVSALSTGTIEFLDSLNVFNALKQLRTVPYDTLVTWEKNWPSVSFQASLLNKPHLGYMVENNLLQTCLLTELKKHPQLTLFDESIIVTSTFQDKPHQVNLTIKKSLNTDLLLRARLVIAADGAQSTTRQLAMIPTHGWDYQQACLLITVQTDSQDKSTTWQEFTPSGPRAYLPLHNHWASLVWYDAHDTLSQIAKLDEFAFHKLIESEFPKRIGNIKVIKKALFPLRRMHCDTYYHQGTVLVGDSAHTINPLAGQGANLGFRDARDLLALISSLYKNGANWYDKSVLSRYESKRRKDNMLMQVGMDALYFGFSNQLKPIQLARNLIFKGVEDSIWLKKKFLRYALG